MGPQVVAGPLRGADGARMSTYVWVVCTGSGYYADSVWTTEEAAIAEAKRLNEWDNEEPWRCVQRWEMDKPMQHWPEMHRWKEEIV